MLRYTNLLLFLTTVPEPRSHCDTCAARAKVGEGPYAHDPERLPVLIVRSAEPFNGETPGGPYTSSDVCWIFLVITSMAERSYFPELLPASFNTPNNLFYVRNHLPVPVIDPKEYQLEIAIEGTGTHAVSLLHVYVLF